MKTLKVNFYVFSGNKGERKSEPDKWMTEGEINGKILVLTGFVLIYEECGHLKVTSWKTLFFMIGDSSLVS